MKLNKLIIREIQKDEIDSVATFIAQGYANDPFFHWCVSNDSNQLNIVSEYYKVYLNAQGAQTQVAYNDNQLVGASVWLPHDVDASIYDDINQVVQAYKDNFQEVADRSHSNEPTNTPFYQLVGIVTDKKYRGQGIGKQLLSYQLNKLDALNIPTYLEASTIFNDQSIYAKFNYQPYGDIMTFAKNAILYPLYREVPHDYQR